MKLFSLLISISSLFLAATAVPISYDPVSSLLDIVGRSPMPMPEPGGPGSAMQTAQQVASGVNDLASGVQSAAAEAGPEAKAAVVVAKFASMILDQIFGAIKAGEHKDALKRRKFT
jgi:X-X-X-Leu-X-X-Gly heptad repeat protein